MHFSQHTVLESENLLETLQCLQKAAQQDTILIVCSRKSVFEDWLHNELHDASDHGAMDEEQPQPFSAFSAQHSLRSIRAFDAITAVFCSDVAHLRAYLSGMLFDASHLATSQGDDQKRHALPLLAVLNAIQLHHDSMAYSAREINRTLASVIDLANHTRRYAVLCEVRRHDDITILPQTLPSDSAALEASVNTHSSWDEDVGIVDAKTRTFGPGSRGWTGRTIRVRQIAERWFVFRQTLPGKS